MDSIVFEHKWDVGDVFYWALISDPHIRPNDENADLKKALEKCRAENIRIIFNGDIADFITLKDPRYNKAHDKTVAAAVINEQVEWVTEFLKPYADLIDLIGIGNHEDVLIKHYGIDPLRFIIKMLNAGGGNIQYGAYRGFITHRFKYAKGSRRKNLVIFRHHGSGGSAPVTGGAIDINRIMTGFDADIYFIGHKHKQTQRGVPVVCVNERGNIYQKLRHGIMTPGFQRPYSVDDFNKTGGNCSFEDRFYDTNPTGWGLLTVRPCNIKKDMALDWTVTMMN